MQSIGTAKSPDGGSCRLSDRVASAARGPWGRPLIKIGLGLGAVVFLSWVGAHSAASSPPPLGESDPEIALTASAVLESTGVEEVPALVEGTKESDSEAKLTDKSDKPDELQTAPPESPPVVGVLPDGRVVINAATSEELCRLPGIGPSRAEKIIALRTRLGGFKNTRQLLRVKGIGPRTLKRMEPLMVLNAPPAPSLAPAERPTEGP